MAINRRLPSRDFPVVPPGKWAWISMLGLTLLLPALILVGVALSEESVTRSSGFYIALLLPLVLSLVLLACMRRRSVRLEDGMLVVRATLYTQRVAVQDFDLAAARVMDLREHREYLPMLKSNGFGLPGFWAGHYRSKGFGKQFLLLTDRSRVLLLPQRSGRHILLSLEHPDALLKALKVGQD